jgi:hypothetical protein
MSSTVSQGKKGMEAPSTSKWKSKESRSQRHLSRGDNLQGITRMTVFANPRSKEREPTAIFLGTTYLHCAKPIPIFLWMWLETA